MGVWGERWVRRRVSREDADAALLMWTVRRAVVAAATPDARTVVHFRFRSAPAPKRCWWLVLDAGAVDLCLRDPGFGVDLTVRSEPRVLASINLGDVTLAASRRRREIRLEVGPRAK